MSNHQDVAYTIEFGGHKQRKREGLPQPGKSLSAPIPRIARLMALAIRLDGLIREGKVRDYAELARRGQVTRARMTQIIRLLDLAPDIQEQILFLPPAHVVNEWKLRPGAGLNERNLRPVVNQIAWDEQRRLFQAVRHKLTDLSPTA
jgi:hypothetical protein